MLRCQFLCYVLKTLFLIKMALKLSYYCKKMQNFRAHLQTPVPPAAGGFAPRLPASGSWGLRLQTPKLAPPLRISGYAPGCTDSVFDIMIYFAVDFVILSFHVLRTLF